MSRSTTSLPAAVSWFAVFLLTVSVIEAQYGWGVTYTPTGICALKGSTVEIRCTYRHPSSHTVEKTFWFTELQGKEAVDLRANPEYAGRVQYICGTNDCTLRITDLRESDSAKYKFRFITNQEGGKYTGSPGVTLSVTGFEVQIREKRSCRVGSCIWFDFECQSSCHLPDRTSYVWYKNGQEITERKEYSFTDYFYPPYIHSFSCAVKGYENVPAPSKCIRGDSCNRVIHADRSICAFKGSSVDISCTYRSHEYSRSKFWFSPKRKYQWHDQFQPEDLSEDSQYSGRVQVLETGSRRSTLRITDLRESDSAEYRFKFVSSDFEWRSSLPGTTLTVKEPDLQVQVIWTSTGPKLICHSSCILTGRSSFVWYKNGEKIQDETSISFRGNVDPEDRYSCVYQGYRSPSVYAPTVPLMFLSPDGDVMKDSAVSLNCSSGANPAAKYTWYKQNQTQVNKEPQLVFSSIQSSDSGEYYCTAENDMGRRTSEYIFVDVKYGPEAATATVSPSGEIVEGSSVNLACSSDANPEANYTWYKENQTVQQGPEGIYKVNSIGSEDRGIYHCKSENQYGQITSTSLFLDVQYAPKPPSVSVSPSGEIVEGTSVTLTCSSDANPEANYTWYKKNEDSPKASGPIFTITDFRSEHSGNYYCEAGNRRGRQNSTLHLTVVAGANTLVVIGSLTAVLLALILLTVFLWIRRHKSVKQQLQSGDRPDNRAQLNMAPVHDTPSAAAQRRPAEQPQELLYASVRFRENQEDALYSNIRPAPPHTQTEAAHDDEGTEYSTIKMGSARSVPRTTHQEDGEGSFALYSTVMKTSVNKT